MADFSHLDATGSATMVNIEAKSSTTRRALVRGFVSVSSECAGKITAEVLSEIIATARTAAILGAKKTSELIPHCHNIFLDKADARIEFDASEARFIVDFETFATGKTGVEMEGFVGCQVALATIYDMIKAVDTCASLGPVLLIEKDGGKTGKWRRENTQ